MYNVTELVGVERGSWQRVVVLIGDPGQQQGTKAGELRVAF